LLIEFARRNANDFAKKRRILGEEIKKLSISSYEVLISVSEIDNEDNENLNLNQREAVGMAQIINKLSKSIKSKEKIEVIIDCPSTNIESWKSYLENFILGRTNLHIVCEHKADVNHISVGAASILAKVRRDAEVEKISKYKQKPSLKGFFNVKRQVEKETKRRPLQ